MQRLSATWVRARRGPKRVVSAAETPAFVVEHERRFGGTLAPSVAVFLTGRECPYTCTFCDLWQGTLDGRTPAGALPRQLEAVRRELGGWPARATLKLYNASSFFDPLAVPPEDLDALAALCAGVERVVVECHPRFLLRHPGLWQQFRDALRPAVLEVGIGLETAEPALHRALGKGTTVDQIERAAGTLLGAGAAWRAFVLIGTPGLGADAYVDDAVAGARWALDRGAAHVSLIPVRPGNGALDELQRRGEWRPPHLAEVERTFEQVLAAVGEPPGPVVTLDLWDLERHAGCAECFPLRRRHLEQANGTGIWSAATGTCSCGWAPT
jgi:radical SAM enzyme (TIGR01210 family)